MNNQSAAISNEGQIDFRLLAARRSKLRFSRFAPVYKEENQHHA